LPDTVAHLWEWYLDLRDSKGGSGVGGLEPIGYPDIDAWSRMTGTAPSRFEVQTLRAIDRAIRDGLSEDA